jgi:plastocyanin
MFSPSNVTIRAGDTIHWVWGSAGHSVTSGPPCRPDNRFCSPDNSSCGAGQTQKQGDTFDFTFTTAGTFPYHCSPHCAFGMQGTIVVVPAGTKIPDAGPPSVDAGSPPLDGGLSPDAGDMTQDAGPTASINIANFAFSPQALTVAPGTTVTVTNSDGTINNVPHSVTSVSAMGQYTAGAVSGISFDTTPFTTGSKTFTIPATAPSGTVIPFFCRIHTTMMPQGTITVQ